MLRLLRSFADWWLAGMFQQDGPVIENWARTERDTRDEIAAYLAANPALCDPDLGACTAHLTCVLSQDVPGDPWLTRTMDTIILV